MISNVRKRDTVACLCNHCYTGNATMRESVNNIKILRVTQQYYGEFMSPATIKTYLVLLVKYPTSFTNFKQILIFSTDFHWSPISNFTVTRPVRAALIHSERRAEEDGNGRTSDRQNVPQKKWYQPTAITI